MSQDENEETLEEPDLPQCDKTGHIPELDYGSTGWDVFYCKVCGIPL